jgi:hypothetical protein
VVQFTKPDYPVLLLLGNGHCRGSDLCLFTLGLVLLHCNHLWTLLFCVGLCFITNQSLTLQPFLILTVPRTSSILRSSHRLLVCLPWSFYCLQGNRTIPFGVLDHLVFLSWTLPILPLADTSIAAISLCGSLHGQNLQLVLTILGENVSTAEFMDCTTPPR